MEQKKYHKIIRYGHRETNGVLNKGDHIVIQEKIDGANASFTRDEYDKLRVFSRNNELNEENTLGGFYNWVHENIDPLTLIPGWLYFGEWLNPHKVRYEKYEKTFILFDVYSTNLSEYGAFENVKLEAERLGLQLVPVFYEGEYKDFEHLESFVGKTDLGGKLGDIETGEGIVVKNVNYTDRFGNQMFVKLVSDHFREVQKQKAPKDPGKKTDEQLFVEYCMTDARVEKLLHKLVDEGVLDENFGIEDMSTILKHINVSLYDDIMEEEKDKLPGEYEEKQIRKAISRGVAQVVKRIINS